MAEPTKVQRMMLAKQGIAMPDGTYYIRNEKDLEDAIHAVGEGDASHDSIRAHCIVRAKELDLSDKIPSNWNSDGSLKHQMTVDEFLEHYGVKGMHWGVRKSTSTASASPVSADHARAVALKSTVRTHGTSALSNDELQTLITRLNLESQHNRLNPAEVAAGKKIVDGIIKFGTPIAKQQLSVFTGKYAADGIAHLVKHLSKNVTVRALS